MGKRQQGCMPRLCRWQGKCFLLRSHLPASITFTCQKLCRPLHFNHRFSPAWPGGSTAPSTPCAPPHQQQGLTGTESLSQRGTRFRHCPRDQWLSKGAAPLHLLLYRVKSSFYNAINSRSVMLVMLLAPRAVEVCAHNLEAFHSVKPQHSTSLL